MKSTTFAAGLTAAISLLPTSAHAETVTVTDPVGDAERRSSGEVIEGVTGDSDITGMEVQALNTEGDDLGVRLLIHVREIDRFSAWRDRAETGLLVRAVFKTDDGFRLTIDGHPNTFLIDPDGKDDWRDCRGKGTNPTPDLTYGRYSDTITIDLPGECFTRARTLTVKAATGLFRKNSRLLDRAETAEPVTFETSTNT